MHCICHSISLLPTARDLVEQEREEPSESAPVKHANPEQDQGNPSASYHIHWALFTFFSYFMIPDCALGHMSCIKALVA
jgi:hypothetical protein